LRELANQQNEEARKKVLMEREQ